MSGYLIPSRKHGLWGVMLPLSGLLLDGHKHPPWEISTLLITIVRPRHQPEGTQEFIKPNSHVSKMERLGPRTHCHVTVKLEVHSRQWLIFLYTRTLTAVGKTIGQACSGTFSKGGHRPSGLGNGYFNF